MAYRFGKRHEHDLLPACIEDYVSATGGPQLAVGIDNWLNPPIDSAQGDSATTPRDLKISRAQTTS